MLSWFQAETIMVGSSWRVGLLAQVRREIHFKIPTKAIHQFLAELKYFTIVQK